ncbi:hypothetical protein [uncultured Pigmentiphaga sp.]|jgi:hypothetical protein|uniref:hypothetical protein n=1 Tax=uncultured Pigmentiphaga sp. TaxID=340361 RepID=UPI002607B754|nr:hypothetical protein [uncultured Pigmentiphaga sp.]
MKKTRILIDLLVYLVIPLLGWNLFRGQISDYWLITLGLVPGLVYTAATVLIEKTWSISGVFLLVMISLNLVVNLLSSTATQAIWNPVWLSAATIVFYALTMAAKRPFGIFFFIDYAHRMGMPRDRAKQLYGHSVNIGHFYKFTAFLMLREVATILVRVVVLLLYGVDGYNQLNISNSIVNYAFTGLTVVYVMYILRNMDHSVLPPQAAAAA